MVLSPTLVHAGRAAFLHPYTQTAAQTLFFQLLGEAVTKTIFAPTGAATNCDLALLQHILNRAVCFARLRPTPLVLSAMVKRFSKNAQKILRETGKDQVTKYMKEQLWPWILSVLRSTDGSCNPQSLAGIDAMKPVGLMQTVRQQPIFIILGVVGAGLAAVAGWRTCQYFRRPVSTDREAGDVDESTDGVMEVERVDETDKTLVAHRVGMLSTLSLVEITGLYGVALTV